MHHLHAGFSVALCMIDCSVYICFVLVLLGI
jgi:hypothetical protein